MLCIPRAMSLASRAPAPEQRLVFDRSERAANSVSGRRYPPVLRISGRTSLAIHFLKRFASGFRLVKDQGCRGHDSFTVSISAAARQLSEHQLFRAVLESKSADGLARVVEVENVADVLCDKPRIAILYHRSDRAVIEPEFG